jgi:actin-related protein 6
MKELQTPHKLRLKVEAARLMSSDKTASKNTSSFTGGGKGKGGGGKPSSDTKSMPPIIHKNIIVLDNGGDTIKIGFAGQRSPTALVPNCACRPQGTKATIIGVDSKDIPDINGLIVRRPIDRGYLTNSQLQKDIWAHCIHEVLKVSETEVKKCWLVMTEPPMNFSTSRQEMDRIVLEEFGFEGVVFVSGALCAMKAHLWQTKDEDLENGDDDDEEKNENAMMEIDDVTDKEYMGFNKAPPRVRASKKQRIKWAREAMTGCVLDVGFSFAHASPVFDGRVADHHVKRLNLGGRALTNYLKELISYRQWNVMDEFALIEDVKLKSVYCQENGDIYEALKEAKKKIRENKIAIKYVLPDGVNTLRGFLADSVLANDGDDASSSESEINEDDDLQTRRRKLKKQKEKAAKGAGSMELAPDAQSLVLVNERFMVPEILFHPSDIGLNQCGIAELVAQSVHHDEANDSLRDQTVEALMWLNVIVTGGCAKIPGLVERLAREIRQFAPAIYPVSVRALDDPISDVFLGLSLLSSTDDDHAPLRDPIQTFCLKHGTKRDEYCVKKNNNSNTYRNERIEQYDRFESTPLGRVKDMHHSSSEKT